MGRRKERKGGIESEGGRNMELDRSRERMRRK